MAKCCPLRFTVIVLTALGCALLYGLRVNMGITIVNMVNSTVGNHSAAGPCGNATPTKKDQVGEYDWSNQMQGYILSSFYWGYLIIMLPGARLAEITSVKWVWFVCVAMNTAGSLLTPLCCDINVYVVLAIRVFQGLGTGATMPAMSLIVARWVPVNERNLMSSITFSGMMIGLVLSTVATGLIEIYLGWRAVFYILGAVCLPYLAVWAIFTADSPQHSKFISEEELNLILSSFGESSGKKGKIIIHWKRVFTSVPFWALFVTHGSANWVGYFLVTDLATYMRKVFQLPMLWLTIVIAISGTASWAFSIVLGKLMDYFRKHRGLSQTHSKKIATIVSFGPIAVLLLGMAFVGCNTAMGCILAILSYMVYGGTFCGWMSNHVDIGAKIAATLMGLTNLAGTVAGIVVPIFVGWVIGDGTDLTSWMIIYIVNAIFAAFVCIFYVFLGSGEDQHYYDEVNE